MNTENNQVEIAKFLAEAGWLRALAVRLVAADEVEDLVQETWVQLAAHPPRHAGSPRGWLAKVARNARRMRTRATVRRRAREAKVPGEAPTLSPEALVQRSQRLRMLAEQVEALREPFRSTVLLHYFEGLSLAEIGRQSNTPDATVRWRLAAGLKQLRLALDAVHGGDRAIWLAGFAAFRVVPEVPAGGAATTGVATGAALSMVTKLVIGGAVVASCVACTTLMRSREAGSEHRAGVDHASATPHARAPDQVAGESAPPDAGAGPSTSTQRASRTFAPGGFAPATAPPRKTQSRAAAKHGSNPRARPGQTQPLSDADALLEARLARVNAPARDAARQDPALLADIEEMLLLRDAATLADACVEAAPVASRGTLVVTVEFVGEADEAVVVQDVSIDAQRSVPPLPDTDPLASCLRESLFLLSELPPTGGATQSKQLLFDSAEPELRLGELSE